MKEHRQITEILRQVQKICLAAARLLLPAAAGPIRLR